jgi:hypothetical protein
MVKWFNNSKGYGFIECDDHPDEHEDIIDVLSETAFWQMYWQKSERGGHHYFVLQGRRKCQD